MQSGSNNPNENPYRSRRYGPPYTGDTYNSGEETHESSAAMQSGVSAVSDDFSAGSLSFATHEPLNYTAGDYSHVPTWSADNLYGFPDSHGRASGYGLGYSSDDGRSSSYFNPPRDTITYGEHAAESSGQHNTYEPLFQSGQNMPDIGFDLPSFQMPPRTLTSAPAPISSADMFNDTTVPLIFEDTLSDPRFSPTCSRSSRSSFDASWSPSDNMMEGRPGANFTTQPTASSSAQPTSMSHLSPDTSSAKPYRCSQPGCSRSYARKFELYRHQRRHTGVKSHHCQVPGCDRGASNGFYRKDHLRQHMRQVHGS